MANSFSNDIYRSPNVYSYLVSGTLGLIVVACVLMFFLGFIHSVMPGGEIALDDGESMSWPIVLMSLTALFEIGMRILTVVFFLMWVYRAFNNLPVLGAQNLEFSPGWAVGWWFIPFANLARGFQIMRELWNESDSDIDPDSRLRKKTETASILGWWWGLYIAGNIVRWIADKIQIETPGFGTAMMIFSALHGIAAVLLIIIVRKITSEQNAKLDKLGNRNRFYVPPAPPEFH